MKANLRSVTVFCLSSVGLLFAPTVFAHTFGAHGAGFFDGFAHPYLGLDHLLAMLAIGLWASQLGGAAIWRVPSTFVAAMVFGASLANSNLDLSWLEAAIAGSVLALGLLIAFSARLSTVFSLMAVAFFALFHGFAHGLEMNQAASPWSYAAGFLLATASLHLVGIMLGLSLRGAGVRWCGGGVAIAATALLFLAV